jgi:DNA polymerase-3 subunit epsilon
MRQIILDTETTGLDPADGHRIVEIAGVEMLNRRLTGKHLHFYLNPDRDSDPGALAVHGLTTEFLSAYPRFEQVAGEVLDYVRDAEVIIHNAPFDLKFLDAELARAGQPAFGTVCAQVTDSLQYARELFPGKRNSLDALCERFDISNAHRTLHGALLDAELLADVWLALTRGQDTLLTGLSEEAGASSASAVIQLDGFDASALPVILATPEESSAHEAYLDGLDKSGGSVWRA